jgi:outer membrane protein assembly factor BamA
VVQTTTAWQPYSLGPGRSGAKDDFNEANMKIAFSSEFRFKILGELKGTFADAGNIWNVYDNVTDEKSTFNGFKSLKDIALGTGFGLRYDLSFFCYLILDLKPIILLMNLEKMV